MGIIAVFIWINDSVKAHLRYTRILGIRIHTHTHCQIEEQIDFFFLFAKVSAASFKIIFFNLFNI